MKIFEKKSSDYMVDDKWGKDVKSSQDNLVIYESGCLISENIVSRFLKHYSFS